jgi:AbrB family looped-hinge helix DNA binding protein
MKLGTITAKGQTTVPKDVRDKLKLKPGDKVYWVVEKGRAILRPKNLSVMDIAGIFHDPARKPLNDKEMEDAIGDAVAEGVVDSMRRR